MKWISATKTSSHPHSTLKILGICGSLRQGSYNRALLKAAIELAPPNLELQIFERLGEIPLYNGDVEAQGDPEPVKAFKDAIQSADALLIATPEYNFGIPGVLKNAIDWASRPADSSVLSGKPAAIMGASPGSVGTARSQLALRQAFLFTETYALLEPQVYVSRAHERIDQQGRVTDERTRKYIAELVEALAEWTIRLRSTQPKKTAA